jgi:hypothetical protein
MRWENGSGCLWVWSVWGGKEAAWERVREEGEVVEELARADEELEGGREEEGTGEEEGEAEGLERG